MRGPEPRARFRFAYAALVLVVAAAVTALLLGGGPAQHPRSPARLRAPVISEARWGELRSSRGLLRFVLGPVAHYGSHYDLRLSRVQFAAPGFAVAETERGRRISMRGGPTAAGCLSHFQGSGVNAIVATGNCVPPWTLVGGRRAAEWLRVENALPKPVVVFVKAF